jgi:hypothetical protein
MLEQNNSERQEEFKVEQNEPEDIFKVILPAKWWYVQNTYSHFVEKNLKIIKLFKNQNRDVPKPKYPGWDISHGDFITTQGPEEKKLTSKQRTFIQIGVLIGFLVFVICLIIVISGWIAEIGSKQ